MQIGKKEFIAGLLFAAISTTALVDISSLQASGKDRVQSEVTFSRQLGLFDDKFLTRKSLQSNISEEAFRHGLARVLHETGIVKAFSIKELEQAGIITSDRPTAVINRKAAAEMILRTIMHSWVIGAMPSLDISETKRTFSDWQPDEKYRMALAYAIKTGLFQGSAGGLFCPDNRLKVKDALTLFKRFHDLAKAYCPSSKMGLFIDVVQDHYMTGPLLNLRRAGAFDLTDLGRRLNGDGNLSAEDLSLMIQGILGHLDCAGHIAQVKQLQRSIGNNSSINRSMLARMAVILVNALPHSQSNQHILYSDVRPTSALANTLSILSKAGIRMGYNNNTFAGREKISRFEAMGLLNKIIFELEPAHPDKNESLERPASNDDFENFKSMLITRKARIRKILNRE